MANRYWVGGTATWDATAGSKWSTTSGGAGGAAVPTAADDVFFSSASGSGTVTTSGTAVVLARSIDFNGFTGTFNHAAATTVNIGSSTPGTGNVALRLATTMTYTVGAAATSLLNLTSTSATQQTITTNGKTIGAITVAATALGSNYVLTGPLVVTGAVTISAGTFDTGNQSVNAGTFNSPNSAIRVLNLGSSTITLTSTNTPVSIGQTGVTLNAGTSTFVCSPISNSFPNNNTSGLIFYNLTLTGSGGRITAGNTFNNITYTGAANKTSSVIFTSTGIVTINGNLSINGNSTINRVLIASASRGVQITLSVAGATSFSSVDFKDITANGPSAPWDLSSITGNSGDGGRNENITFSPAVTQTATGTASLVWSTHAWTTRVPLPQDDVYIPNAFVAGRAISADMPRLGRNITITATGNPSWTQSVAGEVFGSFTLAAGMTTLNANILSFSGTGTNTLTTNGVSFVTTPAFNCFGGTYVLQDDLVATASVSLNSGTLNVNSQTVTSSTFNSTGTLTRELIMGTGTWNLTATIVATVWNTASAGFTFNGPLSTIRIATASANSRTFGSGNKAYGILDYSIAASTGALVITGSSSYATISLSGGARSLQFAATGLFTITDKIEAVGSPGNLITISSNSSGSVATLTKPSGGPISVTSDYTSIQDIRVYQPYSFFAGGGSEDLGNNRNVMFSSAGAYRHQQSRASTVTGTTITNSFLVPPGAGNLLLVYMISVNSTGAVTPPAGWLQATTMTQGSSGYIYYKIADGTELDVTYTQATSRQLSMEIVEYSGFSGEPTLDVTDGNSSSVSVGTLSTTSSVGPTNTAQPALAVAMVGGSATLAALTSQTNGFLQDYTLSNAATVSHAAVKELTTLAPVETTFAWLTPRSSIVTMMAVFKDVPISSQLGSFFPFFN